MRAMVFFGSLLLSAMAAAATPDDSDLDALNVADKAPTATEQASDWHSLVEGAFGDTGRACL